MFDSFSESREGSAHGSLEGGSPEGKGGLSQLLFEAAHTLQGSLQALKSPRAGDAEKGSSQAQVGSVEKHQGGATLAAWQRFFSNPAVQSEEEPTPSLPSQQARQSSGEKQAANNLDASTGCLGWTPKQSQPVQVAVSSRSGLKSGASLSRSQQAIAGSWGRQEGSSISRFSDRVSPLGDLDRDSARESMDLNAVSEISSDVPSSAAPPSTRLPQLSARTSTGTMSHQSHGSLLMPDNEVPHEVFYDFFAAGGQRPSGRWGHSSTSLGDKLFIFGGISKGFHGENFVFHSGKGFWTKIPSSGKNSPPPTFGGAACASRDTIFLFGGKQNQKHCRRLYSLDPVSMQWRAHKESATAPPSCSSHSMTHVGRHGIYTFGGEGRRLSNSVYCLDPDTIKWSQVNTLGVSPPPRQGHSAVWDEADSLIIMGGNNGDKIYGDVRILSLSTGYWSEAKCSGCLPPPRHSHTAVMLQPNLMLLWGGCGEKGMVMNDAYLLNTTSFRWHKLKSIGDPPPGRYHHSCEVVGQRVLLFGGTNAVQFFDSLVGVSVDVGGQLGSLAESLASLTRDSSSVKGDDRSELVRLQLGNHMRQRQAQDMSHLAMTRAEIAERLFEQERKATTRLSAEVQQLKLLLKEADSKCKQQSLAHARDSAALERDRNMEMHRGKELRAQLDAALATIQKQQGEAVAVDGYRNMYQRLVEERGALVDRAVELEHRNHLLEQQVQAQRAQPPPRQESGASSGKVSDPWEQEFDLREGASTPIPPS